MPWPASFPPPAIIVAESLRRVREPQTALAPVVSRGASDVAGAIAACLRPPRASDPPPGWLRPEQVESFGRALAAIRQHGGALVADPVGSGKTWIALAVARALRTPAAVVAPATLGPQWARAAQRAGVAVEVQSHEAWSRGPRLLPAGLVIVDESHRLRHPAIRRYQALAPALRGRRVLLLTGTPIVNRLDDLAAQLALGCRDDALAACGVASLMAWLGSGRVAPGLSALVIRGSAPPAGPERGERAVPATTAEEGRARRAWAAVQSLELSGTPAIRRLLQGLLALALASGLAATVDVLQRYRLLLLHARDAAAAGRPLGRRALTRAFAGDLAQLVCWELVPDPGETTDWPDADVERLDGVIAQLEALAAGEDPKVARLHALLADRRPTIVFAAYRATVHDLRRRLTPRSQIAWCTGEAAGIGPVRLPRETVLAWFRPDGAAGGPGGRAAHLELGPTVLVTTDVAAEGLDLQRAARVVHYDLPWTAVRLEQRAGRVARLGSLHQSVELVRFDAPRLLERRLGLGRALARKRRLGLAEEGTPVWGWGPAVAAHFGGGRRGLAVGVAEGVRGLVGFEVLRGGRVMGTMVGALTEHGWSEAPADLAAAFDAARSAGASGQFGPAARETLRRAAAWARHAAGGGGARLAASPEQVAARRRVRAWARLAIRARDVAAIRLAGRAHGMLQRGLTAGERQLAAAMAAASDADLPALLAQATEPEPEEPLRLRLVGCIHFEPPSR
jgi:hypothetical protein